MRVRLLYFAGVRDVVGRREEDLKLPDAVGTVGRLAAHLVEVHPELRGRLEAVRFAVNESFARDGDELADGDVVALIPPVAGG